MNVTLNEYKVLRSILTNEYNANNGRDNGSAEGTETYSDSINDSREPSGITGRALGGVVSSLDKKGLVVADGWGGRDAGVRLTEAGYNTAKGPSPIE